MLAIESFLKATQPSSHPPLRRPWINKLNGSPATGAIALQLKATLMNAEQENIISPLGHGALKLLKTI